MQIDYSVMIDCHMMLLVECVKSDVRLDIDKYLDSYTEQQKKNWKNSKKIVVYENESQLRSFIKDAIRRKNAGKKYTLVKLRVMSQKE